MKSRHLALALFALLGCNESTGPIAIGGSWQFLYNGMSGTSQGVTVNCNAGTIDFTLTQNGSTFAGSQVGTAQLTCTALGTTVVNETITAETIVNGQLSGTSITFQLGSLVGQHTGTVTGNLISGTATWEVTSGTSTLVLNGTFTAARLD